MPCHSWASSVCEYNQCLLVCTTEDIYSSFYLLPSSSSESSSASWSYMWSEISMVNIVGSFQLLLHHLLNFVINCLLKMCQSLIFRKFDRYFCGTAQKKRLKDKFVLRSEFLSCLAGLEILELEKFQLRRLHVFALKRSTSANIPPSLSNLAHVSFEMSNL